MPTPTERINLTALVPRKGCVKHALPEAITPGERYRIELGGLTDAHTLAGGGVFRVPLTDDAASRGIRLHELAHLKWSPKTGPDKYAHIGLPPALLGGLEDARVNALVCNDAEQGDILRAGYFYGRQGHDPATVLSNTKLDPTGRLVYAVIAYASGLANTVECLVDRSTYRTIRVLGETITNHQRSFQRGTLAAAQLLANMLDADALNANRPEPCGTREAILPEGFSEVLFGERPTHCDAWGPLTVVHVPLPVRIPIPPRISRKTRSTTEGAVLRYPHRLIYGAIFGGPRKAPGGTLLIDASGSMELSSTDVSNVLASAPQAVIADYAGYRNHGSTLRIIARHGRMISADDIEFPYGGINTSDGPAVDWLVKQRPPFVYLTDCVWQGYSGARITWALRRALMAKCNAHRVHIVPTVSDALAVFAHYGKARRGISR